MRPPNTIEAGIILVGGLLAMAVLLAWSNCGCVHAPPEPALELPDSGEVDPCRDTSRRVGLLTPEERRALCIETTSQDWPGSTWDHGLCVSKSLTYTTTPLDGGRLFVDAGTGAGPSAPQMRQEWAAPMTYQPQRECIAGEPCFCAVHPEACDARP